LVNESAGVGGRQKNCSAYRHSITATAGPGFSFEPDGISVSADTEVELTLRNDGSVSHNPHLPGAGEQTATIPPGGTDTLRFTTGEAGTLELRCEVTGHAEAGMTGTIEVR